MPSKEGSPRGRRSVGQLLIKGQQIDGNSTGHYLESGLALSGKTANFMTQNSTGIVFPQGIQISASRYLTANGTAFIATAQATLPSGDHGAAFTVIQNSTGVGVGVNTTGTTWKWLNTTSVQPT